MERIHDAYIELFQVQILRHSFLISYICIVPYLICITTLVILCTDLMGLNGLKPNGLWIFLIHSWKSHSLQNEGLLVCVIIWEGLLLTVVRGVRFCKFPRQEQPLSLFLVTLFAMCHKKQHHPRLQWWQSLFFIE